MRARQIIDGVLAVEEVKEEVLRKTQTAIFVEEQIEQEKKKRETEVSDILERHDDELQSPFSKVAQWVGEIAWYKHLILLTLVVAAAATVGIFLNAIAICAIAAGALYIAIVGLLKLHHYYDQKRFNETTKLAVYAEERLNEGIEEAKEMGAELQDLATGLQGASNTMDANSQAFAAQAQIQLEQTQSTQQLNQQQHQILAELQDTHAIIDQTSERISEAWEPLHSKLAENVALLDKAQQSITQSASTIAQSTVSSTLVHEELAQNVNAFASRVDSLKENASIGLSLIDRLEQSTQRVWESTKEVDQANKELQEVLTTTSEKNSHRDDVIKGFAENRKLAEEDRIRREQTMKELEQNEREFQEELVRVMGRGRSKEKSHRLSYSA
ncbi:hypothetical protein BN59_03694 [Legionella massiliensis]|uniref:Uncharacterized protein n=1 Tax=Legionella massiliensis TaxID=1034943 RepID=A0A078L2F9_9GAMM|nr:hypothetical protein [Legionella massiliensis]CDZ79376.1 hypothetical protein BN59_03694 [Legionella massiliensis]CEE15114.1 hypothetical protein BN1094_03694 [Legionella massiliensis]